MKRRGLIFKIAIVAALTCAVTLVGCSSASKVTEWGEVTKAPEQLPIATITVKDFGVIEAELYPQYAPNTVNNFIALANDGFYDNLTFHRIVKDFVIQGGDPKGDGSGGPGYAIKGEFSGNGFEYNELKHTEGVLSMARAKSNDTAGSQFFIVTKEAKSLDTQYAGFGKVISGLDVVHAIENVEAKKEKPETKIEIESIRVDTKNITYKTPDKM